MGRGRGGGRGGGRGEEVGAAVSGSLEPLVAAPAVDGLMVAGEEDVGDGEAVPHAGSGVVRVVEEWAVVVVAGGEGVLVGGVGVAEGAREKADDGVDEEQCGDLAAGEDVVAHGDLFGGEGLDGPLIDALVVAGDEEESGEGGEAFDGALVEGGALWGEEDAVGGSVVELFGGVDGVAEGLTHHDHAGPAAEGPIVDLGVLVVGVVADVGDGPGDETGVAGASRDAGGEDGLEHLRKDGEHVDAERPGCVQPRVVHGAGGSRVVRLGGAGQAVSSAASEDSAASSCDSAAALAASASSCAFLAAASASALAAASAASLSERLFS